jgi:hypothetical protein
VEGLEAAALAGVLRVRGLPLERLPACAEAKVRRYELEVERLADGLRGPADLVRVGRQAAHAQVSGRLGHLGCPVLPHVLLTAVDDVADALDQHLVGRLLGLGEHDRPVAVDVGDRGRDGAEQEASRGARGAGGDQASREPLDQDRQRRLAGGLGDFGGRTDRDLAGYAVHRGRLGLRPGVPAELRGHLVLELLEDRPHGSEVAVAVEELERHELGRSRRVGGTGDPRRLDVLRLPGLRHLPGDLPPSRAGQTGRTSARRHPLGGGVGRLLARVGRVADGERTSGRGASLLDDVGDLVRQRVV